MKKLFGGHSDDKEAQTMKDGQNMTLFERTNEIRLWNEMNPVISEWVMNETMDSIESWQKLCAWIEDVHNELYDEIKFLCNLNESMN